MSDAPPQVLSGQPRDGQRVIQVLIHEVKGVYLACLHQVLSSHQGIFAVMHVVDEGDLARERKPVLRLDVYEMARLQYVSVGALERVDDQINGRLHGTSTP